METGSRAQSLRSPSRALTSLPQPVNEVQDVIQADSEQEGLEPVNDNVSESHAPNQEDDVDQAEENGSHPEPSTVGNNPAAIRDIC